ncbi:hypothetical protein J6590_097009 [Homalodisca vitripennis]|nr:hypothetical protein J6590_097009 [Homalodisca vitripennis]
MLHVLASETHTRTLPSPPTQTPHLVLLVVCGGVSGTKRHTRLHRPVTILLSVAKMFENLLLDNMGAFFKTKIPNSQRRFYPRLFGKTISSLAVERALKVIKR